MTKTYIQFPHNIGYKNGDDHPHPDTDKLILKDFEVDMNNRSVVPTSNNITLNKESYVVITSDDIILVRDNNGQWIDTTELRIHGMKKINGLITEAIMNNRESRYKTFIKEKK